MKKLAFLVCLGTLIILLGACSQKEKRTINTISQVEIFGRDQQLLQTAADHSMIFDYWVDSSYNELSVIIEKYVNGELETPNYAEISTFIEDKGTIVFAIADQFTNQEASIFAISVGDESGFTSNKTSFQRPSNASSVISGIQNSLDIKKVNTIGAVAYKEGEGSMSGLSVDFFENPEAQLVELQEYDITYLLKVKFKK